MDDLLRLKKEFGLSYLVHNYFPLPQRPFVLNLASPDEDIYGRSVSHCKGAMDVAVELGSSLYGVHAGFLVDPGVGEIGRPFSRHALYERGEALERFAGAIKELAGHAGDRGVKLYVENNVLSNANYRTYDGKSPFLLVSSVDFHELKRMVDFDLLFDIGHLKVSTASLGLSFEDELRELMGYADYIHLSDNNGLVDENRILEKGSELWGLLAGHDLSEKVITLEVYEALEKVVENYQEACRVLGHGDGNRKKVC